jgi:hypothetical protein
MSFAALPADKLRGYRSGRFAVLIGYVNNDPNHGDKGRGDGEFHGNTPDAWGNGFCEV